MQAERAEPLEPLAETEQQQPESAFCFMFEYETVENVTQLKRPAGKLVPDTCNVAY